MRNDQIFVLLLVVLLPMSGCFADAVGDAEGADESTVINNYYNNTTVEYNFPPVIWGSIYFGSHYCGTNSTTSIENVIITRAVSAVDYDGNVTEFGLDTDQDGTIDFPLTNMCDGAEYQVILGTNNSSNWFDPTPMNAGGGLERDSDYCYQDLALIAVDDDGSIGVEPFRINFEYDKEVEECLFESD